MQIRIYNNVECPKLNNLAGKEAAELLASREIEAGNDATISQGNNCWLVDITEAE